MSSLDVSDLKPFGVGLYDGLCDVVGLKEALTDAFESVLRVMV